uniref:Uncharacterized protein n=1 Tax=Amphimedon queenslandica TaxID=400682 RepID=A0A1X7SMK8_AMPQE
MSPRVHKNYLLLMSPTNLL